MNDECAIGSKKDVCLGLPLLSTIYNTCMQHGYAYTYYGLNPLQKRHSVSPTNFPFVPVSVLRKTVAHYTDRGESSSKLMNKNL